MERRSIRRTPPSTPRMRARVESPTTLFSVSGGRRSKVLPSAWGIVAAGAAGPPGRWRGVGRARARRRATAAAGGWAAADAAEELLGPAENHGGRISFRRVALLSILLTVIFGALYLRDRARGGYRAEKLDSKEAV